MITLLPNRNYSFAFEVEKPIHVCVEDVIELGKFDIFDYFVAPTYTKVEPQDGKKGAEFHASRGRHGVVVLIDGKLEATSSFTTRIIGNATIQGYWIWVILLNVLMPLLLLFGIYERSPFGIIFPIFAVPLMWLAIKTFRSRFISRIETRLTKKLKRA